MHKYLNPRKKIHVWPSSVDTDLFNRANYRTAREVVRRSLGIGSRHLLLYHGVFTHERGLYELVRAIQLVRKERRDVRLLLLGKGPAETQLRDFVRLSGLDDVVLFHRAVPYQQVPRFIAAADIGVIPLPDQPQWRYQNPTKLLEYLAMEKPVILTDIPGHREVVGYGKFAFFCQKGRPDEIASAVIEYAHRRSISRASEREIARSFSPDAIAVTLLKAFAQSSSQKKR